MIIFMLQKAGMEAMGCNCNASAVEPDRFETNFGETPNLAIEAG